MEVLVIRGTVIPKSNGLYGTENTVKAIDFVFDTTDEVAKAAQDGKLKIWELFGFSDNLQTAAAIVAGWKALYQEVMDLDETEKEAIVRLITKRTNLTTEKAQKRLAVGLEGIQLLLKIILYVDAVQDLKKIEAA